jgi:hypothetical protein
MSPTMARAAQCVIAEVQEDFIRTGGENYIHMDEIDWYLLHEPIVLEAARSLVYAAQALRGPGVPSLKTAPHMQQVRRGQAAPLDDLVLLQPVQP